MAKGFIRGALWGAGISLGAVTLLSLADDGPTVMQMPRITATVPTEPAATDVQIGSRMQPVTGKFADGAMAPAPDTLAGIAPDVADPAAVPQTGLATALEQADVPQASARDGLAAGNTRAPSVAVAQRGSLTVPTTESRVSISTEPAQPAAPEVVTQTSAFEPVEEPVVAQQSAAEDSAPAAMTDAPEIAQQLDVQVTSIAADPVQPLAPDTQTETSAFTESAQEQSPPAGTVAAEADPAPAEAAPSVMTDVSSPTAPDAAETAALLETYEVAALPVETAPAVKSAAPAPEAAPDRETPQPEVATEVEKPAVQAQVPEGAVSDDLAREPAAPELAMAEDLETPSGADAPQNAGESESAAVEATATLDAQSAAPLPATNEGEAAPALEEAPAPQLALAPAGLVETAPDAVAEPDQAQYVAASNSTESAPEKDEVLINRLPTLTVPAAEPPQPEPQIAPEPAAVVADPDMAPVEKFAVPFENPEGKPVMSIVLMDNGVDLSGDKIGIAALRSFPYPVSFAVDAMLPDVQERIEAYRAEGFEVLAMIDLPEGATAQDAEVNLAVALERVPQAVGVLEGVRTGVQTSIDSGQQVAEILAQTGHGLVTQNQGLNTVQKQAAREGVPSAVIFRDFDAQGQSPTVIRRFLDQAAFRAGQENGVIMLGRLREETISALLLWALNDRASKVALAPVSAALRTSAQ